MTHNKGRFADGRGLKGADVYPEAVVPTRAEQASKAGADAFSGSAKPVVIAEPYDAGVDMDGSAHGHDTHRFVGCER